jgi:uncharacterized protein YndB with AHSA1/START domain
MTGEPNKYDLVVTRAFSAPVAQVWQAWKESDKVKQWWGPLYFTCPVAKMDFREGGTSLVCMRSPEGRDFYNTWTYNKIVPTENLEFVLNFADETGKRIDPVALGLPPDMPQDVRYVITFKSLGANQTEMTITEYGYVSAQTLEMSKAGLEQCLDKMATLF